METYADILRQLATRLDMDYKRNVRHVVSELFTTLHHMTLDAIRWGWVDGDPEPVEDKSNE